MCHMILFKILPSQRVIYSQHDRNFSFSQYILYDEEKNNNTTTKTDLFNSLFTNNNNSTTLNELFGFVILSPFKTDRLFHLIQCTRLYCAYKNQPNIFVQFFFAEKKKKLVLFLNPNRSMCGSETE